MRALIPGAIELVYDNYNALVFAFSTTEQQAGIICSVALYPKWVNLFFMHGSSLKDPEGLLARSGNRIKHVRLSDRTVIKRPGVRDLIVQARSMASGADALSGRGRILIKSISKKQRPRQTPGAKKMKAYPSFDAYLADQPPSNQKIIKKLRAFVKKTAPTLRESVKWGNGCWLDGRAPIAYVYAAPDHTQFGFLAGSQLEDPAGRLEGAGKSVRHVKLRSASDFNEAQFAALLEQAIAIGHPAFSKKEAR